MADHEPLFNLKAVVQQTGIPAASLRAWERRYGILTPVRKANGHRVYPRTEVEKLMRIKGLMAAGMTISQAAAQVNQATELPAPAQTEVERLGGELSSAFAACDGHRAGAVLAEAVELLPLEHVLQKLIRPMLGRLGPFGRTYLRMKLGAWLLMLPRPAATAPTALVMAPDADDLRPLLTAVFLGRRGHRVVYVEGTDAPAGLKPDLVVDPRRWADDLPPDELL